jgi:carboxypeptidase PM20D1
MHRYSRECWPLVFSAASPDTVGGASLLFMWPGSDPSLEPLLLTAHQDVVPADPGDGWDHPPFQGVIHRGRVFGRGAVDFKCGYAGILEACESLLEDRFEPRRTVILAMGHDEEVGGARGAEGITRVLEDSGVTCAMSVDEGGYVHVLPWIRGSAALIGIAEKGYATFTVTAYGAEGHASVPGPPTAAGGLARGITELERNPFPPGPPAELEPLFRGAGLKVVLSTPFGAALSGTTTAVTVIRSGVKENVLPSSGEMLVNCRIIPGESVASTEKRLGDLLTPLGLRVELLRNESLSEPSAISPVDCPEFRAVERAASLHCPGAEVLPGLFAAATDSRHYCRVSRRVYRFVPVMLDHRGVGVLHSVNESVSVRDYHACIGFYRDLILGFC